MSTNVVGNTYDKYGTVNPLARALMAGFLAEVTRLAGSVAPSSVLEVGCGEGHLAAHLLAHLRPRPDRFEASDVSLERVASGLDPAIQFRRASAYQLPWTDGEFDLVVCCEVLEHLDRPEEALDELARVARRAVLLSVPREPVWRALNLARLRYVAALGNTPGHVQHFDRAAIVELARRRLHVQAVRAPLPWTIVLGSPRASARGAPAFPRSGGAATVPRP